VDEVSKLDFEPRAADTEDVSALHPQAVIGAERPASESVTPARDGGASGEPAQRRRSRRGRRRRRDRVDGGPASGGPVTAGEMGTSATAAAEAPAGEKAATPEANETAGRTDGRAMGAAMPGGPVRESRRRRRGRRGRGRAGSGGGVGSNDDNGGDQAVVAERGPAAEARPAASPIAQGSAAARSAPGQPEERGDFDDELEDTVVELDFDDEGGVELDALEAGDEAEIEETPAGPTGTRQMMINVSAGTECRIAILHEGRLEEFFIERESTQSHVGNIYKGRITNVEPSIQAAFIDFGLEKNGFLHISDVQPQYFPNHSGEPEDVGRKIPRHQRPPIQKCFRRGQEVIVQIIKEGVGTKGPTLTSYLSIPGRFLVMMPGMSRHGVSRKIEDDVQRRQMRDLLGQLALPSDMGFILRTAGLGRNKRELQRDLNYLMRLWKTVVERIKRLPGPAELYRESDLVTRTIRDIYTADFDRIVVDDATIAKKVREFLHIAMPRTKTSVETYADREPIFHRFGIEVELERINMRYVPLPSGGSLVIDSTEAMVAIDVNSGRFRSPADAEETALRINIEAAEEIARQLRLRDLGGLIVCDFIDMRHDRNKRKVEQSLRDALKKHKERARILRMSAFGLIEMTRQRQGPSLRRNLYADCPHCRGSGQVKQPESVMLDAMRMIQLAAHNEQAQRIVLNLSSEVAFRLLNQKRNAISQIETETGKSIVIHGDAGCTSDHMEIACDDSRGRPVAIAAPPAPPTALLPTRSNSRGNGAKPRP
jgi:ribonuclease E